MRYSHQFIFSGLKFAIIPFLIYGASLTATAQVFQPVFNPSLTISPVETEIKLDGIISTSEWGKVLPVSNFVERYPGENLKPAVATAVYVTYDRHNLYVAFNCYDDPSSVRATMCQRDQFNGDDAVSVFIDTYGNAAWAYELMVNPYGIQKDFLWSNITGDDSGFDIIWESAATITDSGYQVEIAIPFASLRFPNKEIQTWKVDFWRNHPRESFKQYSWAAYNQDDQCWVCQWGTLQGIKNAKPGRGFEILPSLIWSQVGELKSYQFPDSGLREGRGKAEISLGGKYSINSNITLEATGNPDFSQIESDAAQIDVNSTINLAYPERRPFFQEGSDIFRTLFNSFYTRTVNDPDYAVKVTGRMGNYSLGALTAYDINTPYVIPMDEYDIMVNTGKSLVNMVRGTKSIGNDNMIGFIITDRRFDGGGYGTIASVDTDIRLTQTYSIIGQYIYSFTEEPFDTTFDTGAPDSLFDQGKYTVALDGESFSGDAIITQFRRRARNWNLTIDYNHVAPSYRTETGYDPWNDYRNFSIYSSYDFYPSDGIFERISPQIYADGRWNFNGHQKWALYNTSLNGNLRYAQTYFGLEYHASMENWWDVKFNDLWNLEYFMGSQFNSQIGFEMNINFGRGVARWIPEEGDELFYQFILEVKPIDRLLLEPTITFFRSNSVETGEELLKQSIARTRIRLQVNRALSLRLVMQYNDRSFYGDHYKSWDIDPLITYKINPFSVFYIGSTHDISKIFDQQDQRNEWKQSSRQFFMKLQYLFRA